ncbi:VOC family protein [Dyadobacter sediminis]|uniref:VOC family protein n=1 Tax=Dyadobacter sediminis TaxID=1493691 RepID=A0A5R9KC04_9BACT|nr:VOC family protein [Dyadobacter sediminis]TLU92346.1 VOC family protein [Dyadobacter sediminis]GGB95205.1 glyoxalase [Dyadobacter sediminis]
MKSLGLRTTIYKVTDLHAAKQWYAEAFETEPYFDEPYYAGFNIAGYELGLQPEEGENSAKGENVITYWGVENIGAAYQNLVEMGATEHEAPANVGGEIVVASVSDPWGNMIGLIYNPEFTLS